MPVSRLISHASVTFDRLYSNDHHVSKAVFGCLLLILTIIPFALHDYAPDDPIDVLALNHTWYDFLILHQSLLHSLH